MRLDCADRWPGEPLPPGTRLVVVISPQAPYARTRLETLDLPLAEVPALTIAAEPTNFIYISGASQDHWGLRFCAQGEGNSDDEAHSFLRGVSISRTGSLVTLDSSSPGGMTGGRGELVVDAPAGAPLTVHAVGAVNVQNMTGPVRVTATRARATILNTTGRVDAQGSVVDFAGSEGHVILNADSEINIKLTATRFQGSLSAYAQRQVRVLVPRGIQTRFEAWVSRPRDFVCRADFCSSIKRERNGALYVFKYAGSGSAPSEQVWLRSDQSTVVVDNAN